MTFATEVNIMYFKINITFLNYLFEIFYFMMIYLDDESDMKF